MIKHFSGWEVMTQDLLFCCLKCPSAFRDLKDLLDHLKTAHKVKL